MKEVDKTFITAFERHSSEIELDEHYTNIKAAR
jgi:hypothetical protein